MPSQIANILDSHAATLQRKSDREVFFMNTQSIVQLIQRLEPPWRVARAGSQVPVFFSKVQLANLVLHDSLECGRVEKKVYSGIKGIYNMNKMFFETSRLDICIH